MSDEADKPERPTYEALLAENVALRARIAELESDYPTAPPYPAVKFKPHQLDPNAADSFRRPAYSRRTIK